jgi:hypothetical protein
LAGNFRERGDAAWRDTQYQPGAANFNDDDALAPANRRGGDDPHQSGRSPALRRKLFQQPEAADKERENANQTEAHLQQSGADRRRRGRLCRSIGAEQGKRD